MENNARNIEFCQLTVDIPKLKILTLCDSNHIYKRQTNNDLPCTSVFQKIHTLLILFIMTGALSAMICLVYTIISTCTGNQFISAQSDTIKPKVCSVIVSDKKKNFQKHVTFFVFKDSHFLESIILMWFNYSLMRFIVHVGFLMSQMWFLETCENLVSKKQISILDQKFKLNKPK